MPKITVYFSTDFINEKSQIFRIKEFARNEDGLIENVVKVPGSETTLEELYSRGFTLKHAIQTNNNAHKINIMFFMEH